GHRAVRDAVGHEGPVLTWLAREAACELDGALVVGGERQRVARAVLCGAVADAAHQHHGRPKPDAEWPCDVSRAPCEPRHPFAGSDVNAGGRPWWLVDRDVDEARIRCHL